MEPVLEPVIDTPLVRVVSEEKIRPKKLESEKSNRSRIHISTVKDRPKWIPDHILDHWDPDPYAYQTEEDLMPAGILHGDSLGDIWEVISKRLRKRNLRMLMDSFVLYRDEDGLRNRNAPDLLIVPYQEGDKIRSSYDLEIDPTPVCAFEISSPKSKAKDHDITKLYIEQWGVPTAVIIDSVDSQGHLLDEINLSVWYQDLDTGRAVPAQPNEDGLYWLPEMRMWIGVQEQSVYFIDGDTLEVLLDIESERMAHKDTRKRLNLSIAQTKSERQAALEQAERERTQRLAAEQRVQIAEAELQASQLREKRRTLTLVLNQKFPAASEDTFHQIEQTDDLEQLENWFLQLLSADTLESVFGA